MCAAGLVKQWYRMESRGLQGKPQKVAGMFDCLENISDEYVTIMKEYFLKLAIGT